MIPEISLKRRVLFFLYSTSNIVGSILGILGLLLMCPLGGIIKLTLLNLLIVPGLYFIGYLTVELFFKNPTYHLVIRNEATADEIRHELETLMRTVRTRLSPDIVEKVERIRTSILEILPYIQDLSSADHNIFIIRQTALDYLPETIQNYLNLPPAFATMHSMKDGKTARQILLEQLDVLDQQMQEIAVDFHSNNTQSLLVHGRFLEEKFSKADLLHGE